MPAQIRVNFGRGIVIDTPFEVKPEEASERMSNLDIRTLYQLTPRRGTSTYISSAESGQITKLIRANYISASSIRRYFFIVEATATPLKYDANGVWQELKNNSIDTPASFVFNTRETLYPAHVVFNGRLFLGLSSNVTNNSWINIHESASTPIPYTLGHPAPVAPTTALLAGGSLTSGKWYGYVYTYYNPIFNIETAPSPIATANPSGSNLTVQLTMTQTVDRQFSAVRIYRTAAQNSSALASSATKSLLSTQSMVNGTGTFTFNDDGTGTLGAANSTDDHTQLTSLWRFIKEYNGLLWAVIPPRTIAFCKATATSIYPDWWPDENKFEVGSSGEEITGLEQDPSGAGLLIFTAKSVYRLLGKDSSQIDITRVPGGIGCSFPRTIVSMPGRVRYLGTDSKLWDTNGNAFAHASARIDRFFKQIFSEPGGENDALSPALGWLPVAIYENNRFRISFPPHYLNHVVTSLNTTVVTLTGGTMFNVETKYRITDNSGINLTNVLPGTWCYVVGNTTRAGVVVAKSGSSFFEVEDWRGSPPTSGEQFCLVQNIREYVHNLDFDFWTETRTICSNSYSWWNSSLDNNEVYSAGIDELSGKVIQIENSSMTTDSGTPIQSIWRSNWIYRGPITTFNGLYILQTYTTTLFTLKIYTDYNSASASYTASNVSPSKEQGYFIGVSGVMGYAFQVELTASTMSSVSAIVMEFSK